MIAAHAIPVPQAGPEFQNLAYETFMAGLGLKGLAEAAAGNAVEQKAPGAPEAGKLKRLRALPAAPATVPVAPLWENDESIT